MDHYGDIAYVKGKHMEGIAIGRPNTTIEMSGGTGYQFLFTNLWSCTCSYCKLQYGWVIKKVGRIDDFLLDMPSPHVAE